MNIVLPTRKEEALAGMPVNQPRMDTDQHGIAATGDGSLQMGDGNGSADPEFSSARTDSDEDSHLSPTLCPHRMAEREQNVSDPSGTRPYLGGEAEFLRLLFEFTHSVQLNPDRTVALAAKRWERSLRFKLAVTRQRRRDAGCRNQQSGDRDSLGGDS